MILPDSAFPVIYCCDEVSYSLLGIERNEPLFVQSGQQVEQMFNIMPHLMTNQLGILTKADEKAMQLCTNAIH